MLDRILANALEGLTVIEDETASVGQILAVQMGDFATAAGKRVGHYSMERWLFSGGDGDSQDWDSSSSEAEVTGGRSQSGSQLLGRVQRYEGRHSKDYDLVIIEGLSGYLYDKTVREMIDIISRLVSQTKQKKNFIVTLDKTLLGERTSAYIKAQSDSVLVVRTEISSDRVVRSLYIQKLRGTYPRDKLVKFTLDDNGIQVDTREFLG